MPRADGPLSGVRVVELGGIGPGPFACMMLADLGADITRIERIDEVGHLSMNLRSHKVILRGRRSLALDLRAPEAREVVLRLVAEAEVLVEGFRPGVLERLGLGPDVLHAHNPRLVIGRATGWGQDGPRAGEAGHDINYLAVAGALAPAVGTDGRPVAPLNMLGDFGGGGAMLAFGVLAALLSARMSGRGDVVDSAIVDGAALFTAMLHAMRDDEMWSQPAGGNLLDGGAPFYGTYRTADDRWVALGAIEPEFYRALVAGLELEAELADREQHDHTRWADTRARIAARIAERTREDWLATFENIDACFSPVLDADEVVDEPHLRARSTYIRHDGGVQPAPAPRFASRQLCDPRTTSAPGEHTVEILGQARYTPDEIQSMLERAVVGQARNEAGDPDAA